MDVSAFAALGLSPQILSAIQGEGYTQPTPVQLQVLPEALQGRDVLACAQTGTGKTAAFVLPILEHLSKQPSTRKVRALIVTPTRELASQIAERIETYGMFLQLSHAVIYGGVSQKRNEAALARTPDILVATPGRLLDLMNQGLVRLDGITHFVLDEADRMLDMGFIHDVRRIIAALRQPKQTFLLSATMLPAVETLALSLLKNPLRVTVKPAVVTAELIEQSVVFVAKADKRATLENMLLTDASLVRSLVFTRTKHGANRLAQQLERAKIRVAVIHGNKSQGARERALDDFRTGASPVLIATDVAARGIDIDGITHVINYELPNDPESYIHRIGRTGRAGATGIAISFCDTEERALLHDIEKRIKRRLGGPGGEIPPELPPAPSTVRSFGPRGGGQRRSSQRHQR